MPGDPGCGNCRDGYLRKDENLSKDYEKEMEMGAKAAPAVHGMYYHHFPPPQAWSRD